MSSNDDRDEKTEARDGRDRMNRLQAIWRLHAQLSELVGGVKRAHEKFVEKHRE